MQALSGQILDSFSFASQQAAQNLLAKARRALDDAHGDRARRFVDRAVGLPYDEQDGAAPVTLAAHMDLFSLVTDTLEQAETHDCRWLDAAVDVLDAADEQRRLRARVTPIPDRAELRDPRLTSTASV